MTSRDSTKGVELASDPRVAAALVWPAMFRAVRFRGVVEEVAGEEVRAYWASRPWGSRISAWASRQSQPATGREQLEADFDRYAAQFPDHGSPDDVPVPGSGAGTGCGARRSSSGRGGGTGCTTGSSSPRSAPAVAPRAQDVEAYPSLDDPAAWTVLRLQP